MHVAAVRFTHLSTLDHVSIGLLGGPLWLLLAALAVGVLLATWTYQHTVPRTTRGRKNLLIALRSLGIALLLFAIFQPIFSRSSTTETRPSIGLVLDNSQSMQLLAMNAKGDSNATRIAALKQSVRTIFQAEMLDDSNRLPGYAVGEKTDPLRLPRGIDSLHATASVTDLASIFKTIRETRAQKNIEAIVLYSDGAFTSGASPVFPAIDLGIPVYAVGLGDSAEVRDIAVTELFTNEVGAVGAAQPVDATIHAAGAHAGERITVGLYAESQKIDERAISLNEGISDLPISFNFTPKSEGIVKLSVRASTIDGEITERNNLRLQYVNVLKNKFKIALVAGAPSPDVSFIKAYFENNSSLELRTFIQKEGAEFYEGPMTAAKTSDIDLVVLVGFPIASTSDESLHVIRDLLTKGAKPLLFIPSHTTDYTKLADLRDVMPFKVEGLHPVPNEIKVNAAVDLRSAENPILHIPATEKDIFSWESLAPLFKTETHIEPRAESEVLLGASIQGVKLGEPLLLSRRVGASREIALTGYGLWQWKLTTFGREQAFLAESHSHDTTKLYAQSALDLLLGNCLRWLTTREENKRVRIEPERKFYEAGEKITFTGQVYDESYLPIERATVTAHVTGGKLAQPLDLNLQPLGNGRYSLAIPAGLASGDYAYSGVAVRDGKQIGVDGGRFNVGEFNIEFAEPRMRSDLLRELAARTGGKFYTPETAANLLRDIQSSRQFAPKKIESAHEVALWNAWPLLATALLCFSSEWFIRKRIGML
jgi:hypothetical protein